MIWSHSGHVFDIHYPVPPGIAALILMTLVGVNLTRWTSPTQPTRAALRVAPHAVLSEIALFLLWEIHGGILALYVLAFAAAALALCIVSSRCAPYLAAAILAAAASIYPGTGWGLHILAPALAVGALIGQLAVDRASPRSRALRVVRSYQLPVYTAHLWVLLGLSALGI